MTAIFKIYRWIISPLLGPACRFHPSCSRYMEEAISVYGLCKGMFMGIRRLLRCHPFHEGGYDPVVKLAKHHTAGILRGER